MVDKETQLFMLHDISVQLRTCAQNIERQIGDEQPYFDCSFCWQQLCLRRPEPEIGESS